MPQRPSHPLIAASLDFLMGSLEGTRAKMLGSPSGRVLEVGVGTGLNFPHYDPARVTHLTGVEPDPHMLKRARARVRDDIPTELHPSPAEELPFEDASFDTAVLTWVLCSVEDPVASLRELRRVLVPGGRLIWSEHVVSPYPVARTLQRLINPVWHRMAGGCQMTRPTLQLMAEAGFEEADQHHVGDDAWTLFPMYRGEAQTPTDA